MSIGISTFWFIVAIIFGVGELMTTSLTLIWFSIGALVSMLLSPFIESVFIQVMIFAIVSIVLLVIATKYLVDRDKNQKYICIKSNNYKFSTNNNLLVKVEDGKISTNEVVLKKQEGAVIYGIVLFENGVFIFGINDTRYDYLINIVYN